MILLFRYYQNKIVVIMLVSTLAMWAVIASYIAVSKKNEIILVERDEFGVRVVDSKKEVPIDVENFLNEFVGYFYSYTTENYEKHMDRSINFFTLQVLKNFGPKMNSKFKEMEELKKSKRKYIQSSIITDLYKITESQYEVLINVGKPLDEDDQGSEYRVLFDIGKINHKEKRKLGRTKEKPYGLVITRIKEFYD